METLEALRARYPGAETFRFGDNAMLSAELLALVRAGRKRATCSHQGQEGAFPELGRRDIVLTWDGTPALVIEDGRIARGPVSATCPKEMALMEGENEKPCQLEGRSSAVL